MNVSDLIPVAGLIASVIGAGFVARHQIKKLEIDADKLDQRLGHQDVRIDKLDTATSVLDRRTDTLSKILSPENLEQRTRTIESIRVDVEWIKKRMESL